ncbi:hypothetical protein [Paraburkholderia piptadeniae]|nr:hypothetical protein [Paraburkholderia piptadeniae]
MKLLALLIVSAVLLAACTFVNIEGDNNSVSDTGGHGGGVSLPQSTPTISEQLHHLHNAR